MLERRVVEFNTYGMRSAETYRRWLTAYGTGYRLLSDGGRDAKLERIFSMTLLGTRLKDHHFSYPRLTEYEKKLTLQPSFNLLTVIDLDGIIAPSAVHVFEAVVKDWRCKSIDCLPELLEDIKKRGKSEIKDLKWLAEVANVSDNTVLWTSRFSVPNLLLRLPLSAWFDDPISYFPFLTPKSIAGITKFTHSKVEVITNKSLVSPSNDLTALIDRYQPEHVIYVGSSIRDRELTLRHAEAHPLEAKKVVFADSGHWEI
jgi:hypothetical protein